ncbi:MAG: stress protein [Deltaproteobacteria bacterium]|nr:stress protein [Deltaproteobacteria bacterium]
MIRHIAMFTLKDDAPQGTVEHLEEGLFLLAQTIEEISAYTYGADLGLRDGTWDFAVVADFETPDDFRAYADHPDHVAFIQERLTPVLAQRASLQFEI